MDNKFAILSYAKSREEFISDKKVLGMNSAKADSRYIKKNSPLSVTECEYLSTLGYKVVLPLTEDMANSDIQLKDDVFCGVLNYLKENGVAALKANLHYSYDSLILAASGFYVLPFLLPKFIKRFSKMTEINQASLSVLILDGMPDLTVDILCNISGEINHISILTENADFMLNVANKLYCDSGINIEIFESVNDCNISEADIILNTSMAADNIANQIKRNALYFDMVGCVKKTKDIASRRSDVITMDGIELKASDGYLDNILLEAICCANLGSFRKYINGHFSDYDFDEIADYIEKSDISITTFLRFGKSVGMKEATVK